MQFRFAIAFPVAALTLFGGAMADEPPARAAEPGDQTRVVPQDSFVTPAANAIVQLAAVAQQVTQFAATAIVPPTVADHPAQPVLGTPKPAKSAGKLDKNADTRDRHERLAESAPQPMLRAVGKCQTGTAAWYGGRYVGRRTSSGEQLDTTHATAAHRNLPLNSLARVTNLRNGRSVVVRVTDRGPLNHSLLIDMSPRAAEELHMKEAGLVPVRVEQVVEVPANTQ
jgi:rare lipoprotein A (peptidoglycan hydrolase)